VSEACTSIEQTASHTTESCQIHQRTVHVRRAVLLLPYNERMNDQDIFQTQLIRFVIVWQRATNTRDNQTSEVTRRDAVSDAVNVEDNDWSTVTQSVSLSV